MQTTQVAAATAIFGKVEMAQLLKKIKSGKTKLADNSHDRRGRKMMRSRRKMGVRKRFFTR